MMAEYIEREALKDKFSELLPIGHTIRSIIDEIPTADVVEVRHGRWVKRQFADEPTVFGFRCSECHLTFDVNSNYCPNCGADMRGEKNG